MGDRIKHWAVTFYKLPISSHPFLCIWTFLHELCRYYLWMDNQLPLVCIMATEHISNERRAAVPIQVNGSGGKLYLKVPVKRQWAQSSTFQLAGLKHLYFLHMWQRNSTCCLSHRARRRMATTVRKAAWVSVLFLQDLVHLYPEQPVVLNWIASLFTDGSISEGQVESQRVLTQETEPAGKQMLHFYEPGLEPVIKTQPHCPVMCPPCVGDRVPGGCGVAVCCCCCLFWNNSPLFWRQKESPAFL